MILCFKWSEKNDVFVPWLVMKIKIYIQKMTILNIKKKDFFQTYSVFFIFMPQNYIIHRTNLKVRQGSSRCSEKSAFGIEKLFWFYSNWSFRTNGKQVWQIKKHFCSRKQANQRLLHLMTSLNICLTQYICNEQIFLIVV